MGGDCNLDLSLLAHEQESRRYITSDLSNKYTTCKFYYIFQLFTETLIKDTIYPKDNVY